MDLAVRPNPINRRAIPNQPFSGLRYRHVRKARVQVA